MRIIAAALALTTGALHAYLAWEFFDAGLNRDALIFGGMAAPYFLGVALLLIVTWTRWVVRAGMAYVVLLLVAWLLEGARTEIGYAAKAVEVALLGVLAALEWRGRN